VTVLVGDPHRRYLPPDPDLVAAYRVRTSHELERSTTTASSVFTIPAARAR
jgi:predicted nicotinamide N-methyase